jgi:hypothetical protein
VKLDLFFGMRVSTFNRVYTSSFVLLVSLVFFYLVSIYKGGEGVNFQMVGREWIFCFIFNGYQGSC